ncbi:Enamine deaminase RidA, house cleaning of reactive enamine intermediates, YjgF/YER057c/UK114 family [Burkholderia sp. GAS332]|nr:Enamine deaminase RidA, house cleaning of reactive enamine intermediates, YjgF/YER057c/UK114 family [Burkholderia sp. GAS332]
MAPAFQLSKTMSNEIKRLQTNARMSRVVIANGVVHLAGQVPDTANVPVAEQTKEVLAHIDTLLESAGVDRTRLLSANIWLSDPKHFADFNAVWDAWVPAGHAPTRACVQALLMKPGCDVEVAVTALLA